MVNLKVLNKINKDQNVLVNKNKRVKNDNV